MGQEEENLRPRLSVEISLAEQKRLQKTIPWGLQSAMVRMLIRLMLDMIDEHGEVAIAALLTGKVSALDILRQAERRKESGPIRS